MSVSIALVSGVLQPSPGIVQNLKEDLQQHQLTIQQLTQQMQALTSLKRSRSTSDQPASDSTDSGAVSHATDIQLDTFPGLETNGSPHSADSTAESGAASKSKLTIRTVDLGDEVSTTLSACEHGHAVLQPSAKSIRLSSLSSCAVLTWCSCLCALGDICALFHTASIEPFPWSVHAAGWHTLQLSSDS